jgi:hypothetical protein
MVTCEEKGRLTREYQKATKTFSESVAELQQKMGRSSKEEYKRLQRANEDGVFILSMARLAPEQHVAAHKC